MKKISLSGKIGITLISLYLLIALFGPLLAPSDIGRVNLDNALSTPNSSNFFGTDENGTDLLSLILHGGRTGFIVSAVTVLCGMFIGGILGAFSGYKRGIYDQVIMRSVDIVFSFPGLLLNLYVLSLVKQPTHLHMIFALCITSWASFARLSRGNALSIARRDYIIALQTMGASTYRIVFRHIIPNLLPTLLIQFSFSFATYLLVEAGLAFLGLAPPTPSWGNLIAQGTSYLLVAPHMVLIPGAFLGLAVLGANLLGDGLRDML
ncbi:ABC transporter permease [Myxococcota bacterium]|nr:ABC transporter permease [Myxococcota bacterium]MBU1380910.1 ABC transporter permease [Myxococcota bacterium]MBU1496247.1 ABC transporter permease [Myxococcota bacterium]